MHVFIPRLFCMHAPVIQPLLIQIIHVCTIVNLWRSKLEAIGDALVAAPLFEYVVEHEIPQIVRHIRFIGPFKNVFDVRHCGMH